MNISGDPRHNFSKSVSLSRSMVLTQDTSIPSLLILGKLLTVSDAAAPAMASSSLLRAKLLHRWEPSGTVNFWRVADEAFLVQFHVEADLARAMDGAPWSCDGGHLFLMQQAKPETNLVDQLVGDGFSKADLWVQFHNVPVEYFSAATLNALAMRIGVPVGSPDLGAAPAGLLRARIRVDITQPLARSLPVDLDDGRTDLVVSVVYEQIPSSSLCASCGMIISSSHPVAGHCAKGKGAPTPPPAVAASRSRREKEKPAAAATASTNNVWIRLGSRRSSSTKQQVHPPPVADADINKDDSSSGSSSGATGASTTPPPPAADDDASAAAAISPSRSLREKATVYVPSRLGSRMSSSREQQQPLIGIDDENHSCQPCATASEGPTTTTTSLVSATGTDEHIVPVKVNRCLPINFLNLFSDKKKKELVVGVSDNDIANGSPNLEHMQSSQRHQTQKTLLVTYSAPHHNPPQESLVTNQKDTRPNASLALTTPSSIQLDGGHVNYYSCSGSRKNPRIEVEVKTQCSGELMKKAMGWLAQNTGLKASYDGSKGVIDILGLQVDRRTGPVDLVASLYPRAQPKTGVAEAQEKPDSPARFQNMIIRLHDETCCKGCSGDKCQSSSCFCHTKVID